MRENRTSGSVRVALGNRRFYRKRQKGGTLPTRSVNQGFVAFHSKITPGSYQTGKAASHKASISRRLEEYYDLKQLFYSGSANNGTNIAYLSDVDFFASIPTKKLKENSSTSLRLIKECLQGRFPNTPIYVDSPAVVLNFGAGLWDTAEVIPADYLHQTAAKKNVYDIPDGSGGWMNASPTSHNSYVTAEHRRLSRKLKALIRFAKAWKYYRRVPISSFYLELRIAKMMERESSIFYGIDLATVFRKLCANGLASIRDPMGVSGLVAACPGQASLDSALSKVDTARKRAENARSADSNGKTKDAFYWWDLLFDGNFVNYYY